MIKIIDEVLQKTRGKDAPFPHKVNKGAIFTNQYKKEGTQQPDRNGEINIGGKHYAVSGWVNTKEDGTPYLGIEVTAWEEHIRLRNEARMKREAAVAASAGNTDNLSTGDVPF